MAQMSLVLNIWFTSIRLWLSIYVFCFAPWLCMGSFLTSLALVLLCPWLKIKQAILVTFQITMALLLSRLYSKLFECVLLDICNEYLPSDHLQFGFKKSLGCSNSIFRYAQLLKISGSGVAQFTHPLSMLARHLIMLTITNYRRLY